MGKFANELEGDFSHLGPLSTRDPWHGHNGFDAMGHIVPGFRKAAAQEHMKDMGFTRPGDAELRYGVVSKMANFIERDNSHQALECALAMGVDATGCYRLLSVLLTEECPSD
jgi:hypothetical protein